MASRRSTEGVQGGDGNDEVNGNSGNDALFTTLGISRKPACRVPHRTLISEGGDQRAKPVVTASES